MAPVATPAVEVPVGRGLVPVPGRILGRAVVELTRAGAHQQPHRGLDLLVRAARCRELGVEIRDDVLQPGERGLVALGVLSEYRYIDSKPQPAILAIKA